MKTFTAILSIAIAAAAVDATAVVREAKEVHVANGPGGVAGLQSAVDTSLHLVDVMVETYSKAECCNQTPCFIGCPVQGVPRVGFILFLREKPDSLTSSS